MSFERPHFDQPKTPEIIKTPEEVANELRAKIIALNEKLQQVSGIKDGLEFQCSKKGNQAACKEVPRTEQRIATINRERDSAAAELEKVTRTYAK